MCNNGDSRSIYSVNDAILFVSNSCCRAGGFTLGILVALMNKDGYRQLHSGFDTGLLRLSLGISMNFCWDKALVLYNSGPGKVTGHLC